MTLLKIKGSKERSYVRAATAMSSYVREFVVVLASSWRRGVTAAARTVFLSAAFH